MIEAVAIGGSGWSGPEGVIVGMVAIAAGAAQVAFRRQMARVSLKSFHNIMWRRQFAFERPATEWVGTLVGLAFIAIGVFGIVQSLRSTARPSSTSPWLLVMFVLAAFGIALGWYWRLERSGALAYNVMSALSG